jgi:putative membrane protein
MKKLLILAVALIAPVFAAFAETKALNDAEIIGVVIAVNEAKIDAANLAQSVSSQPDVKMFGQRLIDEHTKASSLFNDWAKKNNITPQSSSTSDSLKADEEQYLAKLKELGGILFDLDYMGHEVESHQQALDLWDSKLIPDATDEGLKSLLGQMRPRLSGHLEQAKLIKKSLGRKK